MSGKIDMAADASRSGAIVSLPWFVGTMVVVATAPLNLFVDLETPPGKQIAINGSGRLE